MPFNRPTLPQLMERSAADIEAELPPGDAHIRRHKLRLLAKINAGSAHSQHGHIAWWADQIMPHTADWESLLKWGDLRGLKPLTASAAYGTLEVTGQPGALVQSGWTYQRADGWEYVVSQTTDLDSSGRAAVPLVALAGGYDGNAAPNTSLRLTRSVAGVSSSGTVISLAGGADAESLESFRQRVIFRWRNPPQAGTLYDYEAWAREAHPAVTRSWAIGNEAGANTVTVRIVTDNDPNGLIPSQAVLDQVYAYIRSVMPATPTLFVVAPIPVPVAVALQVLPDTPEVRAAVELEVRDWFLTDSDIQPGGEVYRSRLSEAISKASGERAHTLIQPAADLMFGTGEIPTFGTLTWSN
ncbi:baseplate J/gp47 family protein [Pseudomonas resinovorans]|uniref:Baseplate J/gp47 family protein n=1 Tax=Metapseudomonas resinovorans TaxID=53412 RepID=A0ABT4Y422_METRE|nr:baseplate J/gp47 family protein [Pseudomonas resinovorans]MDA8483584.1 baseplate J/gp47 family protein [Pseudomonas resinovorans]